ncbi:hypothetical protein D3C87_1655170 [compost metagenome]
MARDESRRSSDNSKLEFADPLRAHDQHIYFWLFRKLLEVAFQSRREDITGHQPCPDFFDDTHTAWSHFITEENIFST